MVRAIPFQLGEVGARDLGEIVVRLLGDPVTFDYLSLELGLARQRLLGVEIHHFAGKLGHRFLELLGALPVGADRGDDEGLEGLGKLLADGGDGLGGPGGDEHAFSHGHLVADNVGDRVRLAGARRARDADDMQLGVVDHVGNLALLLVEREREEMDLPAGCEGVGQRGVATRWGGTARAWASAWLARGGWLPALARGAAENGAVEPEGGDVGPGLVGRGRGITLDRGGHLGGLVVDAGAQRV